MSTEQMPAGSQQAGSSSAPGAETHAPGPPSSRRKKSRGRLTARIILVLLFLAGLFLSATPWGRAATRAALLLPALISVFEPAPLAASGDPVRFTRTTISSANGPVYLDIYEPATPPPPVPGGRAAIISIVGVGDNRADKQLINFSRSLAASGIVVMNVGTPSLFNFVLARQDGEAVVAAFNALLHHPGVDPRRIGLLGFSAGNAIACFGAADPRIRDRIAFITSFGGYFDTSDLLRDIGRRALTVDGRTQPWQPLYVPLQVFANTLGGILPADEATLLEHSFAQNGKPLTPAEQAQLSPAALAAYHLLRGDQPARVDQNMAALSPQMRALLNQLSPASVVNDLRAPIYLLHDRSDQYVPFSETRDFAAALARLHHPHDLAEFGIFQHVEVRSGLNPGQLLGDAAQLYRIIYKITLVGS